MLASQLKAQLNEEKIIAVLEHMGCQGIRPGKDYITAARPGGDNKNGICVYLNGNFNSEMFTSPEFDRFHVKDFITVVQYCKNLSFPRAMDYICQVTGLNYYQSSGQPQSQALRWLNQVETVGRSQQEMPLRVLPEQVLDQFIPYLYRGWREEGITPLVAAAFQISYDVESNGVAIPIHSAIGDLVGVKIRSLDPELIAADKKYWYLYPTSKTRILYGQHQNYPAIRQQGACIVAEGEKSVLKAASYGLHHCLACGGKKLSQWQCEELLRLNVPIILAPDCDVSPSEIEAMAHSLTYPVAISPIYLLQDKKGEFLKAKESPFDNRQMALQWQNLAYRIA